MAEMPSGVLKLLSRLARIIKTAANTVSHQNSGQPLIINDLLVKRCASTFTTSLVLIPVAVIGT